MLSPKRVRFRKQQKGRMMGAATRGNQILNGEFALQATGCGYITNRQIEAARIAISRKMKRGGNMWIKIFPDKSLSRKPAEVRMGGGKGSPEYWVAEIQPGKMLYEMDGVSEELAREAFELAAAKLPISTVFVIRQVGQ